MGPTWVLSAPDGSHVVPMNFAIRVSDDRRKLIPTHPGTFPLYRSLCPYTSNPIIAVPLNCTRVTNHRKSWISVKDSWYYLYNCRVNLFSVCVNASIYFVKSVILHRHPKPTSCLLGYTTTSADGVYTVKPVFNDHLYYEIYYLWFIQ